MPPRSPPWKTCSPSSASYLSNLRNNKPTRPTGSRPPPFKSNTYNTATVQNGPLARSDSAPLFQSNDRPGRTTDISEDHHGMSKSSSFSSSLSHKARPLATASHNHVPSVRGRKVSPTATVQQGDPLPEDYRDSTSRKLEREEAKTLRDALDIIDQRDEDKAVFDAAQMEAADLVWKHRNPQAAVEEQKAPYYNPDLSAKKSYGSQLPQDKVENGRNVSDSSTSSQDTNTSKTSKRTSRGKDSRLSTALKQLHVASTERSAAILAAAKSERRRSSGQRVISNGSGKGLFRNPEDQIYEEPGLLEDGVTEFRQSELPLKRRSRNSLPRDSKLLPDKPGSLSNYETPRINRVDIFKKPSHAVKETPPTLPTLQGR